MIVYTSKQEKINLAQKPFSSGGEGSVYAVNSAPSRFKDICVKIYSPGKTDQLREAKIKFMVSNPPQTIRGKGFLIGWPLDYVTDSHGKFLGFIMPLAFPNSRQLVELTVYSLSKVLGKEWHDRYDISAGKKSLISRLKLIFNIATPIHILHSTNKYVLKDFKPQNVLVTYDGHVTIVDLDSIQISDGGQMLYPGTAVTPEYMPPEFFTKGIGKSLKSPINKSWDYFAIGVVFYEILMGIHPYCVTPKKLNDISENSRSSNISLGLFPFGANKQMIEVRPRPHDRFTKLPQEFQNKFISTFSEKPGNRPSAYEWKQYMYDVIKGIDGVEEKIQDKKEFDSESRLERDMRITELETYNQCKTKEDFLRYIRLYPDGMYVYAATQRIYHFDEINSGLGGDNNKNIDSSSNVTLGNIKKKKKASLKEILVLLISAIILYAAAYLIRDNCDESFGNILNLLSYFPYMLFAFEVVSNKKLGIVICIAGWFVMLFLWSDYAIQPIQTALGILGLCSFFAVGAYLLMYQEKS
jgi:serine/threonine protein kinase